MRTLVVFLGSRIAGDDSAGYAVYEKIKDACPARAMYLGTDLFRLYGVYEGEERLVMVDAVHGTSDVVHLRDDEIFAIDNRSSSIHFLSLVEALKILRTVMSSFPLEIHLIGIPAKSVRKVTYDENVLVKAMRILDTIIK